MPHVITYNAAISLAQTQALACLSPPLQHVLEASTLHCVRVSRTTFSQLVVGNWDGVPVLDLPSIQPRYWDVVPLLD